MQDKAREFVCLRMTRMNGVDLNLFPFDHDLTWFSFFMDADCRIYSRYGGRDVESPDGRLSARGLLYVMDEVRILHARALKEPVPPPKRGAPRRADELPLMKELLQTHKDGCIHCHMVKDVQHAQSQKEGRLNRANLWIDPLPDTIGVQLDIERGTYIARVIRGSPADKAGLRAGDRLLSANGTRLVSAYDLQGVLDGVPSTGRVEMVVQRAGAEQKATLELTGNWRKADISWRKSIRELPPSIGFYGRPLEPGEKKQLRLSAEQLGFRLQWVGAETVAGKAGLQAGDTIIAVDEKREIPYRQLRSYFPLEHRSGDRVRLDYLRDGKAGSVTICLP